VWRAGSRYRPLERLADVLDFGGTKIIHSRPVDNVTNLAKQPKRIGWHRASDDEAIAKIVQSETRPEKRLE
jgi:hypothetical protein